MGLPDIVNEALIREGYGYLPKDIYRVTLYKALPDFQKNIKEEVRFAGSSISEAISQFESDLVSICGICRGNELFYFHDDHSDGITILSRKLVGVSLETNIRYTLVLSTHFIQKIE